MEITFSDSISITSLYFALVSLLGSIFFFSISQWLSDIMGNSAAWKALKDIDPDKKEIQARLGCYHSAKKSSSFVTILVWFVISSFLIFIEYNIYQIYFGVDTVIQCHLYRYVILPSMIFIVLYFILSILFISIGYYKSNKIVNEY